MKKLVTLIFVTLSSATFACPNFTGKYKTSDNITYSLFQKNCISMDMVDGSNQKTILFNGQEQLIYDFDMETDGKVVGRVNVFISSMLIDEKWVYDEKTIKKYDNGKIEVETGKWAEVFLNTKQDLETLVHTANGQVETYIDTRVD